MIQIWMEGYADNGGQSGAQMIGEYDVKTFDEAVELYMKTRSAKELEDYGPHRNKMTSPRGSNWNIWGCSLFDNEADARKSFG